MSHIKELETAEREIKRANFRMIEKELFHYNVRRKEFLSYRQEIIEETGSQELGMPTQQSLGNVTQSKVLRLNTGVMLEIEKRLNSIEYGINKIKAAPEPLKYELIKLKYLDQNLTNQGIMLKLNIGHDTFYRWRKEFMALVAERLGWEI